MKSVGDKWQESIERVMQAQLQAGQSAFEALNEHDKLMQMLRTLAVSVEEVFSCMDMANMEIAAALGRAAQDTKEKEAHEHLLLMNEQNARAAEQFAQMLQDVMTEAELGSETIHRMEEDIASVQEAFCELCEAADELEKSDG